MTDQEDNTLARTQLVLLQLDRVKRRAEVAYEQGDREAMRACRDEMEVLHESMCRIREEQLLEEIERNRPKPKRRRWWQRADR